jgi:hypothetical protein
VSNERLSCSLDVVTIGAARDHVDIVLVRRLSPLYPDTLMVGMELRDKVSAYVRERICECDSCSRAGHVTRWQLSMMAAHAGAAAEAVSCCRLCSRHP